MCSALPTTMAEPTTDAEAIPPGTVATGLAAAPPPGTVWGYADLHMHLLAHLAHGGGVLAGTPYAYDWTTNVDGGFMKALAPDYVTDLALVTGGGFVGASDTGVLSVENNKVIKQAADAKTVAVYVPLALLRRHAEDDDSAEAIAEIAVKSARSQGAL